MTARTCVRCQERAFVQYCSDMSERLEIEHRDLRSAIEFAVLVAEEANKGKRSLPFPKELRAQFGVARIPTGALGRLRRVIEADDTFRRRIAVGAVPELVDPDRDPVVAAAGRDGTFRFENCSPPVRPRHTTPTCGRH